MIRADILARYAGSKTEYEEGARLAEAGQVEILNVDRFWKDEVRVKAKVTDELFERECSVNFTVTGVRRFYCDCMKRRHLASGSYYGLCSHSVAAVLAYIREEEIQSRRERRAVTSRDARFLLQAYGVKESALLQNRFSNPVRLEASIREEWDGWKLYLKIGRERMYMVKNIRSLGGSLIRQETVEYGKNLTLLHSLESFDEASRPLAQFLKEEVQSWNSYGAAYVGKGKDFPIRGNNADRLMEALQILGEKYPQNLKAVRADGAEVPLKIVHQDPSLPLVLEPLGSDGARIRPEKRIRLMQGQRYLYLKEEGIRDITLYVCSEEFTSRCGAVLERLYDDRGDGHLEFSASDMVKFCVQVLPDIAGYLPIENQGVDLDQYEPEMLHTSFYFDKTDSGQIRLEVTERYGDVTFRPGMENPPAGLYRDTLGEERVLVTCGNFFPIRKPDEGAWETGTEAEIYRLFHEGMPLFWELGEVYASEAFQSIKVRKPVKGRVHVGFAGGFLDLKLDLDGIDRAELAEVLESYRRRRSWHRLKNGDFLPLPESGTLTAIGRLQDGLGLSEEELESGEIHADARYADFVSETLRKDSMEVYRDPAFLERLRLMHEPDEKQYSLSDRMKETLHRYQKEGYLWLRTLDDFGFGGILADDMGLGKTAQTIAVVEALHEEGRTLIVCPASLIYNWEAEFERFAPGLQVVPVVGDAETRKNLLSTDHGDVWVTSYELLRRDISHYEKLHFRLCVIDEAQAIKNAGTYNARSVKSIDAGTRFALTGTPVENRLGELWSIFDYLMPGYLGTEKDFRKKFELPIMKDSDKEASAELNDLVRPFLLRRKKKEVLQDLPDKVETTVSVRMDPVQEKLYKAQAMHLAQELQEQSDGDFRKNSVQVLAGLTRLRQLCCDPHLLYENYEGTSAKLDACMDMLKSVVDAGHKVLVFSQFTSMLDIIGQRLEKEEIAHYDLRGTTPKEVRMERVNRFAKDDVPVFLISLKAGGTGLNLTAADIVIHFDPWWNVAAENQASDRTHRIGQDKEVSVFRLIVKGTIEEQIVKMQERKKELAESVVEQEGVGLASIDREELIRILST